MEIWEIVPIIVVKSIIVPYEFISKNDFMSSSVVI